jgi:circadian clock protein KaiC
MTVTNNTVKPITKLSTGIRGFDWISDGGLPENRTTLISGTAGSGKTIFAVQFLAEGIIQNESGAVFVTFEESPEDVRRNMINFGWDIKKWEEEGKWTFVDASLSPEESVLVAGQYDLGALLARIEFAIRKVNAKRVSIDSIGAIYTQFNDVSIVRREIFRISAAMKRLGVTVMLTAERQHEYGEIARQGVEEFVSDNVMILRNIAEYEKRRRTVEILKFRGTTHKKGEFPFTITGKEGVIIIPLYSINLVQKPTNVRIKTGIPEFDEMTGGGLFRDSVAMVSGPTGTGKTLMTTSFVRGGVENGERSILFAFEESAEQIIRNAASWGIDYEEMEKSGLLRIVSVYPEETSFENHLLTIFGHIDEFKPARVALDSLSAMQGISTTRGFREFTIGLTSFIKERQIASIYTSVSTAMTKDKTADDVHLSTLTDAIVLLRYMEIEGTMRRAIAILKMRGSRHDNHVRGFVINDTGMHIGEQVKNYMGMTTGRILL